MAKKVYYSYIIAHHDSSYKSLGAMKGCEFAFTDPHSNSGCLVPRYMLSQKGYKAEDFFRKIIFTNAHDKSINAVAKGIVEGAAVDSLVWEFINIVKPDITAQTRVVEKSPPYGIPPVVVHPDLDEKLKSRLKEALFSIHKSEKGANILKELHIERFEEGRDEDYNTIREMQRWTGCQTKSVK